MTLKEKTAMWHGFHDELEKISSLRRMEKFSSAFFEKHAKDLAKQRHKPAGEKKKYHGIGGAIAGGAGGAVLALPIGAKKTINEFTDAKNRGEDILKKVRTRLDHVQDRYDRYWDAVHKRPKSEWGRVSKAGERIPNLMAQAAARGGREAGHVFGRAGSRAILRHGLAATGGAIAGGVIGQQIHSRLQKRKAEKAKHSSVAETASQVLRHPALRHFAAGALPGAAVGAATAKKGKRTKAALKGGAFGGALTLTGGHLYHRAKRDYEVVGRAAQEHGFGLKDMKNVSKDVADKIYNRAQELKQTTPIYKTSSKKEDDSWDRPSDSVWHKHKKKIIGGSLAAATAAGVGHHLLTRKRPPKNGSLIPKSIWDEFKIRRAAKRRVKLTTEPFEESGNLRGFKDGKRHGVKEVKIHNRHRGHEESLPAAIAGDKVVGTSTTAHAEGAGGVEGRPPKKVKSYAHVGTDITAHSPTKRPPEDRATIEARLKRIAELKKERDAVP